MWVGWDRTRPPPETPPRQPASLSGVWCSPCHALPCLPMPKPHLACRGRCALHLVGHTPCRSLRVAALACDCLNISCTERRSPIPGRGTNEPGVHGFLQTHILTPRARGEPDLGFVGCGLPWASILLSLAAEGRFLDTGLLLLNLFAAERGIPVPTRDRGFSLQD